ncbi:aquaporin-7-like isoform X2 [Octopus sinensis]|uniref:Aquaporin-7-like isoform X2 n=1 Tax=Octopus sinensis TaxID=2607531 RepID=A0A7E6FKF1_9MOLL|nr:aquaporin-7-like isoform X2 [Octopus sinensis]
MPKSIRITNKLVRCFLAEFLGTFILLLVGIAGVAQVVLSEKADGDFFSINACWGMAVTLGVYASAEVSGAHLNPAVTVALAIFRKFSWNHVPVYFVAQYLASFAGAAVVYFVYKDGLDNFDGGIRQVTGQNASAGIFATYPKSFVSTGRCFADQIVGTGLLTLCIAAITDGKNMKPQKGLLPFSIGSIVFMIGVTFGFNCGYAINPARDLSPRLFTLMAGWGTEVFSFRDYNWFWVPIIGPHIGAILGILLYDVTVGLHWESSEPEIDHEAKNLKDGAFASMTLEKVAATTSSQRLMESNLTDTN